MQDISIVVIGAGAIGCAIARELSKYECEVHVLDKNEDVGGDASKANSAIVHTGYDATPGTLESQLVVAANPMFDYLTEQLDVPFKRIGAILPAVNSEQFDKLPSIHEKALQNRVMDVQYMSGQELLRMEPNLNPSVLGGLFIPRESIIDPFLWVVALAENASQNGVTFHLDTEVTGLMSENGRITGVRTKRCNFEASVVINAAALYSEEIARMAGKDDYYVNPRKGQFFILDKATSCKVNHIVLPIPTKLTKGKLVSPTIHGNMLVGPTAEDLHDKEDRSTTSEGLDSIANDARNLVPAIKLSDTIMQFSGIRPNRNPEGLHVNMYDDLTGYVNLSGIRSTGLTISPAMAKYVVQQLGYQGFHLKPKSDFYPVRKGIMQFKRLSIEAQDALIKEDARFGNIVCRCEQVTEGEIVQAIHARIPARSMDAVKRRLHVGSGRCQGGFCGPHLLEILARELCIPPGEITKRGGDSKMIVGSLRTIEKGGRQA